ncbi:MAG: bifunctional DNA-formamidopyrimidine glycosylase/DNA-(apurinic or apyrimidinic site) lyase [Pseudobdellovibrionaceae bacterium]
MPELPEVEVVCRQLDSLLVEQPKIQKIQFHRKDLRDPMPIKQIQSLVGQSFDKIYRRAKYILTQTSGGTLISHLGMTGTWRALSDPMKHDHVYITFSNHLVLAYRDPRRFGILDFCLNSDLPKHKRLTALGPEPLSVDFTAQYLQQRLQGKTAALKVALMDQSVVVGVGNIYANESLFMAGVCPRRPAQDIPLKNLKKIVDCVRIVLQAAIDKGGSTLQDYLQLQGEKGQYQGHFHVYDRKGLPCLNCSKPIIAEFLGGRNTFWCEKCQK